MGGTRPCLIIVTSTYPRWKNDDEPRFTHDLARHLLPFFRVIVVAPRAPGAADRETLDGVEVSRYGYAPRRLETLVNNGGIVGNLRRSPWKMILVPSFILSAIFQLRRLIVSEQAAVVHAHWLVPGGVVAVLGGRRTPFVVTAHGSDVFALRGRLFGWLKAAVMRRAACITAVSEPMAAKLINDGAPVRRLTVMPMGTDLSLFSTAGHIAREPCHLLFVGRLVEIKGCDVLLRAFASVARDMPALRLTIVGDGPRRLFLQALAKDLGIHERVFFRGAIGHDLLVDYYRKASFLVWPSIILQTGQQEGLGMIVPEALACGCPVVASDQPAMRWLFDGTGQNLVAPGDAKALSVAIRARLTAPDQFKTPDEAARSRVAQRMSWHVVAQQYAEVLSGAARE